MCQCCPHLETSKLICYAIQMTGFYMRATLAPYGLILYTLFGDDHLLDGTIQKRKQT